MFAIDDATILAVRRAYEESGEVTAAVELRQRFAGVGDLAHARRVVRIILGWQPVSDTAPIEPQ